MTLLSVLDEDLDTEEMLPRGFMELLLWLGLGKDRICRITFRSTKQSLLN